MSTRPRTPIGLVLAIAAIVSLIPQLAGSQRAGGGADAVVQAVKAHWQAISAGDRAAIESHHTADFTMFMPEFRTLVTTQSPEVREVVAKARSTWSVRDIKVQMFGSTAVATLFLDGSTTYGDGRVDSRMRRVTEVWVNQNGAWKESHHHDSVYSPAQ